VVHQAIPRVAQVAVMASAFPFRRRRFAFHTVTAPVSNGQMEVSGMDGTDLRLMFVLGLGVLTLAIAVLARAVERLVAGWRAYRLTAVETATRHASVAAREASPPRPFGFP
jgi:hypothetical protein